MRTFAIGDVHGCCDELEELLRLVNYSASEDRLVFVGDLIDRGPRSADVVHIVRRLQQEGNVVVVRGNHDDNAARWFTRVRQERETGRKNLMRPPRQSRLAEWANLTDQDIEWIAGLPVVAEVAPQWLAVHAGFEDKPMGEQKDDKVMRCRWIDTTTGKMIPIKDTDAIDAQPEGAVWWTERWKGDDNIVYGHAVHDLQKVRVDRNKDGAECWGIDTGACFGGHLTALSLETKEIFQVKALRAYAQLSNYLAGKTTT